LTPLLPIKPESTCASRLKIRKNKRQVALFPEKMGMF